MCFQILAAHSAFQRIVQLKRRSIDIATASLPYRFHYNASMLLAHFISRIRWLAFDRHCRSALHGEECTAHSAASGFRFLLPLMP
jgi:hypothetical protein